MDYRMTILEMKKACSENKYLLFRKVSGKLVGCNGLLPNLKPTGNKLRRGDNYKTSNIGFIPCSLNE